jgi:hypothetical protein
MRIAAIMLVSGCLAIAGCGSDEEPTTGATTTEAVETGPTSAEEAVEAQNDAVIDQAAQAPDAAAGAGEDEIRATLKKELGMTADGDFNLPGNEPEAGVIQVGGDCYVKTGAEAVNFADTKHTLYSPDGADLVWVQTSTETALVDCLSAVQKALDW